jgi:dihydroflavonol-4-reductase
MRAFVTGSTGLSGINLVRILHQAGHEVWALAGSREKAEQTLGDMAARNVVGDIRKVSEFAPCLKGIDVVFSYRRLFPRINDCGRYGS